MDFSLRCNSLKCRMQLTERAVVTTCSHIFCIPCSNDLDLSNPTGGQRVCPACQTVLANPDDAVSTQLNPSEDYKTSVLSGLSPTAIMECAGRGLAFWSYQSTQEIVYQEYLARTLTDKYGKLSMQMDKIIHDANAEIDNLSQRLTSMQIDQDKLKTENSNLAAAYREKSRKHQQTQELYDKVRRKEMTAITQSAAYDTVDEVLQSVTGHQAHGGNNHTSYGAHLRPVNRGQATSGHFSLDSNAREHNHQRDGSNGSVGSGRLMPPPIHRPVQGYSTHAPDSHHEVNMTPSLHRTRLGQPIQTTAHQGPSGIRSLGALATGTSHTQTPSQRRPLGGLSGNSSSKPGVSGYGMSAGLKVGRQQGTYGNIPDARSAHQHYSPRQIFDNPGGHH